MKDRVKPTIIQQVGFDFSWDEKKVWSLDVLIEECVMPIRHIRSISCGGAAAGCRCDFSGCVENFAA